ncbi:MAG: hypothetical protein ACOCQN_02775 [Halanaerobiaceae bacterium]
MKAVDNKAKRIDVLKDGEMTGLGTHEKLMEENKIYRGFVNKQINKQ